MLCRAGVELSRAGVESASVSSRVGLVLSSRPRCRVESGCC